MKKASLSLSVNAIVVLVLAFLMLGVGIFFTNFLKEKLLISNIKIIEITDLEIPPTADQPVIFPNEVRINKGRPKNQEVGFYNTLNDVATDAKIGIDQCVNTDNPGCGNWDTLSSNEIDDLIKISSPQDDVEPSKAAAYKIVMRTEDEAKSGCTYICSLMVYNEVTGEPYEKKQFFLIIAS